MKILILEDDVTRTNYFKKKLIGHELTFTQFSKECIKLLSENLYDVLFLDHDLGGAIHVASGENTGYEVAQYLYKNTDRKPEQIIIHSLNTVGARNIKQLLPTALIRPGCWL